jgi:hypothetical protein
VEAGGGRKGRQWGVGYGGEEEMRKLRMDRWAGVEIGDVNRMG